MLTKTGIDGVGHDASGPQLGWVRDGVSLRWHVICAIYTIYHLCVLQAYTFTISDLFELQPNR